MIAYLIKLQKTIKIISFKFQNIRYRDLFFTWKFIQFVSEYKMNRDPTMTFCV